MNAMMKLLEQIDINAGKPSRPTINGTLAQTTEHHCPVRYEKGHTLWDAARDQDAESSTHQGSNA